MASVTLNDDGEFHRLLTNGRPRAAVLTLNDDGEFHRLLTNGFTFRTQHVQLSSPSGQESDDKCARFY